MSLPEICIILRLCVAICSDVSDVAMLQLIVYLNNTFVVQLGIATDVARQLFVDFLDYEEEDNN